MEEEVKDKWLALSDQAKRYGMSSDIGNHVIPDWFDPQKFEESRKYLKKTFMKGILSIFNGMLFSFVEDSLAAPHLYWDSMPDLSCATKLATGVAHHARLWAEADMMDTESKAYQSIRNVRSIHALIANKMNDRDGLVEGRDVVWINQFDLVLVFIRSMELGQILPASYPRLYTSEQERRSVQYFVRVVLYSLGVEDKFNVIAWPMDQLEQVSRQDFWNNLYPLLLSKQNLSKVTDHTYHHDQCDKSFTKAFYWILIREIKIILANAKTENTEVVKVRPSITYNLVKRAALRCPTPVFMFFIRRKKRLVALAKRLNI